MNSELRRMLVVDDDPADREMIMNVLESQPGLSGRVDLAHDGAEALDYVYRRGAFSQRSFLDPKVILLDLKMPRVDGLEVLRAVKGDPLCRHIPIVTFTASEEERDIRQCYALGANGFLIKHMRPADFRAGVEDFAHYWFLQNRTLSVPPA